jgi:hypothetical protein
VKIEHRDIQGAPIKVGDIVCYAALWSRSATLRYGRVTELAERKERSWDDSEPIPTLRVVTVDRNYNDQWEFQNKGRPVTLSFLDRMMVVPDEMVAPDALTLLRSTELGPEP